MKTLVLGLTLIVMIVTQLAIAMPVDAAQDMEALDALANSAYAFGNPAGCATTNPNLSSAEMLANVQTALGSEYDLSARRERYLWNGSQMVDASNDPFVYEFQFNEFQHPLTYRGDKVATIFLTHGFVVWFRVYRGAFRLMAVPMTNGVMDSAWAGYISAYWQDNALPADEFIYPVMKKLPCHWVVDAGYVSNESLHQMFDLNWHVPDYMSAGQAYLASNCEEAHRISQEKIGYWDATSVCGPLAWTMMRDANGFPYRIGSWYASPAAFINANPKWNAQPWGTFDPETFSTHASREPSARLRF
jgi:hypothetical protein